MNDVTERDQVMRVWKELIKQAEEERSHKAVNELTKIAFKDVAFLIAVGAFAASVLAVLVVIITK